MSTVVHRAALLPRGPASHAGHGGGTTGPRRGHRPVDLEGTQSVPPLTAGQQSQSIDWRGSPAGAAVPVTDRWGTGGSPELRRAPWAHMAGPQPLGEGGAPVAHRPCGILSQRGQAAGPWPAQPHEADTAILKTPVESSRGHSLNLP